MSSCRRLFTFIVMIALASCVTEAEQTASQTDMRNLGRQLEGSHGMNVLAQIPPEELEAAVKDMVATPIKFWGRVENEAGQPIPDAQVIVISFDRPADPFLFPYVSYTQFPTLTTDKEGRFVVRDTTGAALIVSVAKTGYQSVTGASRRLAYAEALRAGGELPTETNPAVFVFERTAFEELRPIATGALPLPESGESLPLSIRSIRPYGVDPEEVEATVLCEQEAANSDGRFPWRCSLTIPGGGAQRMRLEFDRAPEDGYAETIEFGDAVDDADWDHRRRERIVIRFPDQTYAFTNFRIRLTGERNVSFKGVWNPTGSRVLD